MEQCFAERGEAELRQWDNAVLAMDQDVGLSYTNVMLEELWWLFRYNVLCLETTASSGPNMNRHLMGHRFNRTVRFFILIIVWK
jgi:hypothetical protein